MLKRLQKWLLFGNAEDSNVFVSPDCENAYAAWETIQNKQCLVITFRNMFRESDAVRLTRYLTAQLNEYSGKELVPVICRCSDMTDYEAHSRIIFQDFLQKNTHKIQGLWIVTQSNAIKYGGKLISMFIKIPVQIVDDESKIRFT